ncbi:MAG: hypothetical protein II266_07500 [Clostridia bacterium]|nr:hypothetical protein [Clostridia bacterium]
MARILTMVLALMMAVSSALAVQYVVFEDIPGEWNNYESAVGWMNTEYAPSSEYVWLETELLEGGQVAPGVLEFIADPAYAYQNPDEICAYLYIDAPGEILYVSVFEGNWATREYMLLNCTATDGMYVDIFFPSFDRSGKLLNTDRIYLYEYEKDGQWHYECVTFYFRYDGEETRSFLPEITKSVSVKKPETTLVPEAADETVVAVDSEPANEERDAEIIIAEDEDAIIGIIGGADGPTSVTIAGSEGFTDFFGKLFSGVVNGIEEEMVSVQTEPLETEEPAFIIPEEDALETDPYEEMAEVTEETDTAEQAWDVSGGMRDFFSGVFGGFGK